MCSDFLILTKIYFDIMYIYIFFFHAIDNMSNFQRFCILVVHSTSFHDRKGVFSRHRNDNFTLNHPIKPYFLMPLLSLSFYFVHGLDPSFSFNSGFGANSYTSTTLLTMSSQIPICYKPNLLVC